VLNAANEVAVSAFLEDRLAFPAIAAVIEQAMDGFERNGGVHVAGLADVRTIDEWARDFATRATTSVRTAS
jgi:1-deoxy-D-xylulose-5-phosphate reductoisomerase